MEDLTFEREWTSSLVNLSVMVLVVAFSLEALDESLKKPLEMQNEALQIRHTF